MLIGKTANWLLRHSRGTARRQVVQTDPRRDVIGPSTRPIAIGAVVEQPGGQRTGFSSFLA